MEDQQMTTTNWKEITSEEAYRLTMAEFKGAMIQAVQDLKEDVSEVKQQGNITRYISFAISGLSGIIAGIFGGHLK